APSWRLGELLDGIAERTPDATALIVGAERRRIGYAALAELVVEQCAALRRSGLRPGDVVTLRATNSIEFVVALLAAARADLVVAPVDPALPAAERRARADRVGARVTLTDAHVPDPGASGADCPEWRLEALQPGTSHAKPVSHLVTGDPARAIAAPVPGLTNRDALIMVTSGTTGTPKLVPWTHDNLAGAIAGIAAAYRLSPSDATVAAMPLFHGHGLIATLLTTLATGGAIVLPARGRFAAHTFWDDFATVDATWYTAVPTIHQILLDRVPIDLPGGYHDRLRFVRSCSAPLSAATAERIEATLNAPVLAAYGMTEATHQATSVLPSDDRRTRWHTVGTPTGVSVRIVDRDGNACPLGATGEIWLCGPTVVRGYLDNTTATASTFVDGWVRTGDLGSVGDDGILTVQGRIKELINRGGEKISPEHVEEVLMSYPGVADAAVFGVPDDLYGERVAAVIVPHNGFHVGPSDLTRYCRDRLAPFEIPERIAFADRLPLTPKGSVDRFQVARSFR
ncbi:FadD7 family fatty acid--CoA ligase, partial [Mycobacterium sp.]|uniref:FadD7 family fatty acid--CoA ligase n=1 Tax=Mycobacterium sp. TaxID=1785 RepID=UPI002D5B0BA7